MASPTMALWAELDTHYVAQIFTIKELEKIAPKLKGITQQTVKDVVEELLAEGKLENDKIGR